MTTLLNFMQYKSALGLKDKFREGDREIFADEALGIEFTALCNTFSSAGIQTPILFSVDSFDTLDLQYGKPQEDKFAAQIRRGIPNAKICHMRLYATEKGAHWHALFAQLDDQGQLKEIIITDSSRGITAKRDMQLNPFLCQNAEKINQEQGFGLQQPPATPICWIYALANLASLATTGKVYTRQNSKLPLGEELRQCILPSQEDETKEKVTISKKTTTKTNPSIFFSPPVNLQASSPKVDKVLSSSASEDKKDKPASSSTAGKSLLLLGAGGIAAGAIVLAIPSPVSLVLGLALIAIGIIMTLAGAFILIDNCVESNEPEESPRLSF